MTLMSVDLSDKQFKKVSNIIYRSCGINLKDGKEALVRARLVKRLRALRMESINLLMCSRLPIKNNHESS